MNVERGFDVDRILTANLTLPGSRYKIIDPPLAVAVTGSLFFDMDHVAGVVGTGDFKPDTSWEIHPVTSITFAP